MKTILSVFISLTLITAIHSQNGNYLYEPTGQEIDSLYFAYKNATHDTTKMELSRKIAFYYHEKNKDTALYYQQMQLELARKLGLKIWEADALELSGFITQNMGQYPVSLKYFQQAFRIAEDQKSEKDNWRSDFLSKKGTPEAARLTVLAFIHIDAAGLYNSTGNHQKQMTSLLEAIRIAKIIDDHALLSFAYGSIGEDFSEHNKLDTSLFYLQMALMYADSANYHKYSGGVWTSIGNINYKRGDIKKARLSYDNSIRSSLKTGNYEAIGTTFFTLAEFFANTGQHDSAMIYAYKGLNISDNVRSPQNMLEGYDILASLYAQSGVMDSAYHYQSMAIATSDSMYSEEKIVHLQNLDFSEQIRLAELQEEKEKYQNKVRFRALLSGLVFLLAIAAALYWNNRSRRKSLKLVKRQRNDLQSAMAELKNAQVQLVHAEKMASLGELTAGIAHEIQNPLNFVNNFSEVSGDLLTELGDEIKDGNTEEVNDIVWDLRQNLTKITEHGHRASGIVKAMLEHSRSGEMVKELIDINELADEYLRLSYHGLRAKDKSFNASFSADLDDTIPKIEVIPQEIGRVLLNMINNAFYAVSLRSREENSDYKPAVTIQTKMTDTHVEIRVKDNGAGIPEEAREKIFQPFYTTKPSGEGTGLGLSLSYDIITKGHGGELLLETEAGKGTEFIIVLPV